MSKVNLEDYLKYNPTRVITFYPGKPIDYIEWTIPSKDNTVFPVYHREGGPARMWNDGGEEWYYMGKPHRLDGPAFYFPNDDSLKPEWYVHGKRVDCKTQEEFEHMIKLIAFW